MLYLSLLPVSITQERQTAGSSSGHRCLGLSSRCTAAPLPTGQPPLQRATSQTTQQPRHRRDTAQKQISHSCQNGTDATWKCEQAHTKCGCQRIQTLDHSLPELMCNYGVYFGYAGTAAMPALRPRQHAQLPGSDSGTQQGATAMQEHLICLLAYFSSSTVTRW